MKNTFAKKVMLVCAVAVIAIVTTSQKPGKATNPVLTDSIPILSIKDVQNFNVMLKQGATYDQYTKLTPEATLAELVNWKVKQIQADTTKNK